MNQTSIDPEVRYLSQNIEIKTGKQTLSVSECAKYCDAKPAFIYRAIKRGELKAVGKRNMRIASIAFAKWFLQKNG